MNNATVTTGIRKVVMSRAHEIARTLEGDYSARLSYALKQAWAEARQVVSQQQEVKEEVAVTKKQEGFVFLFGVHPKALPNQGDMAIRKNKGGNLNAKHHIWRQKMVPTMTASICKSFESRTNKELYVIRKHGIELLMADVWPHVKKRHPEARLVLVEMTGPGELSFSSFGQKGDWTAAKAVAELERLADAKGTRAMHVTHLADVMAKAADEILLFGSESFQDASVDVVKQAIRQGTPAQLISVDTLVRTVVVAGKPVERKALYGNISFAKGETSWEVFKVDLDAMVKHVSEQSTIELTPVSASEPMTFYPVEEQAPIKVTLRPTVSASQDF